MNNADKLRQALREAGVPLCCADLADAADVDVEAVRKFVYAAKQRGELITSLVDGKPAKALAPAYVRVGKGHRTKRTASPATPAQPEPQPQPEAEAQPEATPAQQLAGFARTASTLADETLERAVRMPVAPDLVLQLTQAARLLHTATLRLHGISA